MDRSEDFEWLRASHKESGIVPTSRTEQEQTRDSTVLSRGALQEPGSYTPLLNLSSTGRARVSIGVGLDDLTLDRLVVIKRFSASAAATPPDVLDAELALASALDHPNIVRTLCVEGRGEQDGPCAVTEYLDGVTLSELIDWDAEPRDISAAVVLHILIALLEAVRHGQKVAGAVTSCRLCELPIAAGDVFVTYDGRVKVLGFKPARHWSSTGAEPAVDALLSRYRVPELRALVAWCSSDLWSTAPRATFVAAKPGEPGHEGRAALARVMKRVDPVARARRAGRLVSAFARRRAERACAARRLTGARSY